MGSDLHGLESTDRITYLLRVLLLAEEEEVESYQLQTELVPQEDGRYSHQMTHSVHTYPLKSKFC